MISTNCDCEIEKKFGFSDYFGLDKQLGWLLNYQINSLGNTMEASLYFIKTDKSGFKIKVPYYPTFLLETTDNAAVTEYMYKKYRKEIHKIIIREKVNTKDYNHLNIPKKQYLKIYVLHENDLNRLIRDIKTIFFNKRKSNNETYNIHDDDVEVTNKILNFYEYDIPRDIAIADELNFRVGMWYDVAYDGENYIIQACATKILFPDLKIFAYDIETYKLPLKFPNPDNDPIIMISIRTESNGYLIINREYVSQDIKSFSYAPKPELKTEFIVYNEKNEEMLLTKFIELFQMHKPHVITTFNGEFFDFPFIEKRLKIHNYSLTQLTGIQKQVNSYSAPWTIHLDCYKWVKRDSYLPISSQGLKSATKAKLGYIPDEIDPEDMVKCAMECPQKMASYSASDAVATYFLYIKFVHAHIFSLGTLIPLPPIKILSKGSGSLCEALLITQANLFDILIPNVPQEQSLTYYDDYIIENTSYIGGHVESLKAGIFRADFFHLFEYNDEIIRLIIDNLDDIFEKYKLEETYINEKQRIVSELNKCKGTISDQGNIYHFDVGAMYPNIILTNRLQPTSVVDPSICIRCDYNDENNNCKKVLDWTNRIEYYPLTRAEVNNIINQLDKQEFFNENNDKITFKELPENQRTILIKKHVEMYSKKIYKKIKYKKEIIKKTIICQREIPFYVNTIKTFKNQRYIMKKKYQQSIKEFKLNPTKDNMEQMVVYNSLQVAYKCVLNSFYGYVMRKGSRWWSIETAAITCKIGGEIIKLAKNFLSGFGIPLELDTDGIWTIIPKYFPNEITIGNTKISFLQEILNYFVCNSFTNTQYQEKLNDGSYKISDQNSIVFEIDGPYKTMVIPSSIEENKLLKKKYIVYNFDNQIIEIKGFEIKRQGELNFIKKFQEDIFQQFCSGNTLTECYTNLSNTANYWLNILLTKGQYVDDETLFDLFVESRNMSKSIDDYYDKKSNILSAARKLAEILGEDILKEKLKCEFIISKFPENLSIADRCLPLIIFKSDDKETFLKKWIGERESYQIRDIIDWDYYKSRFTIVLQRLIIIPAHLQGLNNILTSIDNVKWTQRNTKTFFETTTNIEDIKVNVKQFYTKGKVRNSNILKIEDDLQSYQLTTSHLDENEKLLHPKKYNKIKQYIHAILHVWTDFYYNRKKHPVCAYKIEYKNNQLFLYNFCGTIVKDFKHKLLLDLNDKRFFTHLPKVQMTLKHINNKELYQFEVTPEELNDYKKKYFFDHFSIKNIYNLISPIIQGILDHNCYIGNFDYIILTSAIIQGQIIYFITYNQNGIIKFIEKNYHTTGDSPNDKALFKQVKNIDMIFVNKNDKNSILQAQQTGSVLAYTNIFTPTTLQPLPEIKLLHQNLHVSIQKEISLKFEINKFTGIPLLNIEDDTVLDMLYLKILNSQNIVISIPDRDLFISAYKHEIVHSGYYDTYSIQIECECSVLWAVIEYKSLLNDTQLKSFCTKEFITLRKFIKNLIVQSAEQNEGAVHMLSKINIWIKHKSKYISHELKEIINFLHHQYLINLVNSLTKLQIKIFCASKDIIFINTEKTTLEQCNQFINFLKTKVSSIAEYDLLTINTIRIFKKLAFIDPSTYYYIKDNAIYGSSTNYNIPDKFLEFYFKNAYIDNHFIYNIITTTNIESAKLMLRLLSYKRDTHGLVSNCYKLLNISEFTNHRTYELNLIIFCQNCGCENFIRNICIKCLKLIDKSIIESECIKYINYCFYQQIEGDKYCPTCCIIQESKLKEYCSCGKKYEFKNYIDEFNAIKYCFPTTKLTAKIDKIISFLK